MNRIIRTVLSATIATVALPLFASQSAYAATSAPRCIVSLSPTATETLFAIGAGKQVQAVDTDSNYPTKGLPKKTINAFSPSVEAILGICHASGSNASTKPNLVVISYDANSIQEKLTALGIKVVNQGAPTNLQGAYSQILTLGRLTGHTKKAKHLVSTMKKEIAASVASVPAHAGKSLTTYYELDTTYYSLTSSTFVGGLMTLVGMSNIADAKNTSADAGYPQLSAEYIASANPKLILLADTICCHATQQSVAARPGFAHIAAVTHDDVIGLNDDIASRWGPRLPLLVAALAKAARNAFASTTLWK